MVFVLGVLLGLGLLGILRLARGLPLLPERTGTRIRRRPRWASRDNRPLILGGLVAVAVLVVLRNPVFAVIAGAVVMLWPLVTGGGRAERAALAKIEALAKWTEALRDLAQKDSGLESVIPKTLDTADDLLVPPLRLLSQRLSVRVPVPQALTLFADDVDDPSADLVVAALALAARQRRGQLSRVLTALAGSLRAELEQKTRVMAERNTVRREAVQVVAITILIVLGAALFTPVGAPDSVGAIGQVLTLLCAAAFVVIFIRVSQLARPEPEARFLASDDAVLEAASYRPTGVSL